MSTSSLESSTSARDDDDVSAGITSLPDLPKNFRAVAQALQASRLEVPEDSRGELDDYCKSLEDRTPTHSSVTEVACAASCLLSGSQWAKGALIEHDWDSLVFITKDNLPSMMADEALVRNSIDLCNDPADLTLSMALSGKTMALRTRQYLTDCLGKRHGGMMTAGLDEAYASESHDTATNIYEKLWQAISPSETEEEEETGTRFQPSVALDAYSSLRAEYPALPEVPESVFEQIRNEHASWVASLDARSNQRSHRRAEGSGASGGAETNTSRGGRERKPASNRTSKL